MLLPTVLYTPSCVTPGKMRRRRRVGCDQDKDRAKYAWNSTDKTDVLNLLNLKLNNAPIYMY